MSEDEVKKLGEMLVDIGIVTEKMNRLESENKNLLARKEELLHYGKKQSARVEYLESENARLRKAMESIADCHACSGCSSRAKSALEGEK